MVEQEGTAALRSHQTETEGGDAAASRAASPAHDTATCETISRMLARISDKWTILVVRRLGRGACRFNSLRREIGEISQKMLSSTLRDLEENGFVTRTVTHTAPPQVEYALTDLGRDFLSPVYALADWVVANSTRINAAREEYAARAGK